MNRRMLFQTAALGWSLLLPDALRAGDWPEFRGPNRDGVWNETGLVESFPAGGLKIGWRAPLGTVFSRPVVAPLLSPTSPYGARKRAWTPPAFADGHVFARGDEELVCAYELSPGHKADGAEFNHFGVVNAMKQFDNPGTLWLDNVTVNGEREESGSDPNWDASGNRRNLRDPGAGRQGNGRAVPPVRPCHAVG